MASSGRRNFNRVASCCGADCRIVQHPNPDRHLTVETVDVNKLDVNPPLNPPLDFEAIRKGADKSEKY